MSTSEIDAAVAGFLGELDSREPLSKTPPAPTPMKDESAEDLRRELVSAVAATIEEVLRRRGLR